MKHRPGALYRLQFNSEFTFFSARTLIYYLSSLGITDVYASPIMTAKKGSDHGYDVTNPESVNPELGGDAGLYGLIGELKSQSISWISDFVPNHMAFDPENIYLSDLLENGARSEYISFFDALWDFSVDNGNNRLLFPVLGTYYWISLKNKEIQLVYNENGLFVTYKTITIPLFIGSYHLFFSHNLKGLEDRLGSVHPDIVKMHGIIQSITTLHAIPDRKSHKNQVIFIKGILWDLYTSNQDIRLFIEENLGYFNGKYEDSSSFLPLNTLLDSQVFRLSYWKVATEELNFRRFFTINSLICLNVERPEVFSRVHSELFKLIRGGWVSGVRIDHIDGLYDPLGYLKKIRKKNPDLYLMVEKILDYNENLPSSWPVEGTTGYDFLNMVNGLFCYHSNEEEFTRIYATFIGENPDYCDLVCAKKRSIIEKHMAGDIDNLSRLFKHLSDGSVWGSDITLFGMRKCLVELICAFPVYRTYISPDTISNQDREVIRDAIAYSKKNNPDFTYELEFLEDFLLEKPDLFTSAVKDEWIRVIMRFQQYTPVAMAKGFEDTALYSYNRLISLNEVGGRPDRFGITIPEFHEFNLNRARNWPDALNTTSTHDTKRCEDFRARINVLSEIPGEWEEILRNWSVLNCVYKRISDNLKIPSRNDEYFLYQTLVGTIPFQGEEIDDYLNRVREYLMKALREAQDHTTWINPDPVYETGYGRFLDDILDRKKNDLFIVEVIRFANRIAHYGIFNSLSQLILKITSPGIPDFYQGTELWSLCMVDPDNRRPVDYVKRISYLDDLIVNTSRKRKNTLSMLLKTRHDGQIKLFLMFLLLSMRKNEHELFSNGFYEPLKIQGTLGNHLVSFARILGDKYAIIIVPRFFTSLISDQELPIGKKIWKETKLILPDGYPQNWVDTISGINTTGTEIDIGDIFKHFPGAVLLNKVSSS